MNATNPIETLAEQAANELADLFSPGFFDDRMVNDVAEINKKFAELIVQECARIARATPFPDTDVEVRKTFGHTWDMAASEAGREIVNHFGVNSNVE